MFDFLTLPQRTTKPRESGLTHVLDKGLSLDQVRQFLEVAGDYVDIVKLGWGTACVTPNVKEKVALYQSHGVPVCFGGTFFEVCLRQNKLEEWLALVRECEMTCVEISDGTIAMEEEDKLALLRRFSCGVQGPQRGRQQGRLRHHHADQVGRLHQARARGRRLEGHHRGSRVRHGRHLPPHRRREGRAAGGDPRGVRHLADPLRGARSRSSRPGSSSSSAPT